MNQSGFYDAALERAEEVLGSRARGKQWLDEMSNTLGCHPKDLLTSQDGYEQVLRHLHSVEVALNTDA